MKPIAFRKVGKMPGSKDPKKFYYVNSQRQFGEFYIDDKKMKNRESIVNEMERQKSEVEKGPEVYAAKDKADAMKRAKREQKDFKIAVVLEIEHDKEVSRMKLTDELQLGANIAYQAKRKEMKRKLQEMEDKKSRTWFKNPFKNKRDGR